MAVTPNPTDLQSWSVTRIAELEAELERYRSGTVNAWASRRIAELEGENAALRDEIAGPFTSLAKNRSRAIRAQRELADSRFRRHKVTKRLRWLLLERDNHRCVYCGATASDATLVIDHKLPVIDGGTNEPSNLVTACSDCNDGKRDRPLMGDFPR